jgi:prevent-host-death family protein
MKIITVTEANQSFSKLIRELEQDGEGYVILRRGRPVARLIPGKDEHLADPVWQGAYTRMMARLQEGASLGGLRINRDELHER